MYILCTGKQDVIYVDPECRCRLALHTPQGSQVYNMINMSSHTNSVWSFNDCLELRNALNTYTTEQSFAYVIAI